MTRGKAHRDATPEPEKEVMPNAVEHCSYCVEGTNGETHWDGSVRDILCGECDGTGIRADERAKFAPSAEVMEAVDVILFEYRRGEGSMDCALSVMAQVAALDRLMGEK